MITISNAAKEILLTDWDRTYIEEQVYKNIRISFPNGEHDDITNEKIVSESVSLTESVFTNEFKFGLCEASVFQFTAYDIDNIKGCEIFVTLELIRNASVVESIPYGLFLVDSCKRKASSSEREVTAYTPDFISDDAVSSTVDIYGGISAMEYLKRTAYCNKANYEMLFYKSMFSNYRVSPSMYRDDTSSSALPVAFSSGEGFGFRLRTGESRSLMFDFRQYQLNTDDKHLYKYEAISRHDAQVLTNTIADYIGKVNYEDSFFREQIFYNLRCLSEIFTYSTDVTKSNKVAFWGDLPLFYPYISLTSADKARANASSSSYYIRIVWRVVLYDGNNQPLKVWSVATPSVKPVLLNLPSTINVDAVTSYARVKKAKKSSLYNFPYLKKTPLSKTESISTKDLLEADLELNGLYGIAGRSGGIEFRRLSKSISGLTPGEWIAPYSTLTPSESVDGSGGVETVRQSEYSSIWYADADSIPYGKVTCKCTPSDDEEEVTFEADVISGIDNLGISYKVYDITNNVRIKNFKYTTAEVQAFCDNVASYLADFVYTPIEVTQVGLPYVEAGDWVEYIRNDGSPITSIVAKRTLKGIQNLQDTITAEE